MRTAFVIWAREVKLNEFLAREINAQTIISYKKTWKGFDIPVFFRYFIQGFDTYKKLQAMKPEIIFVMNPPITAVLTVYLYSKFNNCRFAIDTHTAGFIDRKWVFFHWLHKFLAKRAILNTVHNYKNLEFPQKWGIENGYVLQFYNPSREEVISENSKLSLKLENKIKESSGIKVFMVNRFAGDDAWKEVIETAKIMPEALFLLTGDDKKIKEKEKNIFPDNVILTGYLNHGEFMKLMDKSDVVLALTKRRDTVLWSIREIMALRKPFITSDSEAIRHYFSEVALFTNHQPDDMKLKIIEANKKSGKIKEEIEKFLEKDAIRWKKDIEFLNKAISKANSKA